MWLVDYYHQVEPIFFVISIIVGLGLSLMAVTIIITNIMHIILTPRLDPILFNERWFTGAELVMYSAWPFSLIRSVAYMELIGFPKWIVKTKRFKNYDLDLSFSKSIVFASKTCIFIALTAIFLGASFLIVVLYGFIKAEFF